MQLNALREKLKNKHEGDLTFDMYSSMANSDLMVQSGKEENVLIVSYQGRMLFPVLVEGDRIRAFSVMNKGSKKVFLLP